VLLLPLLCGFLLYLFLLIVWVKYEDWIDSIPWPAEWIELSEWVRSLFRNCRGKGLAIPFRMPERKVSSVRKTAPKVELAAPAVTPVEPPKMPLQVAFSPLGATDGTPKSGFVWNEKDEID
jgi:hypothetical protein